MSLDLLLIHPASRAGAYQTLGRELAAIEPPAWAGLMAAYARLKGHSVAILDAEAEELTAEETARLALEARPRLIAVIVYGHNPSASTQVMPAAGAICSAVKALEPEMPVLLAGGHVAALPERTLSEEMADFTCAGEGPVTLVELLAALRTPVPDWSKVSDLVYREDGRVTRSSTRAPLVTALDEEMPGPAWDLLPMHRYRAHNWHCLGGLDRKPYAAFHTTLGCSYGCDFCCIQAPFRSGEVALSMRGNSYRRWSPRRVVDTLGQLATRYGVRNVKLADEMFVLDRRHVEAICDLIVERGLDLNLWAYARVDTVAKHDLQKMRRAGFRWLALGIESADPGVRADVAKAYRHEAVAQALERVRQAGIHVIGNYMFGLPEDTLETMRRTLEMAVEMRCEFANFNCAMAYPGSRLHARALENRWALPEGWSGYSQHAVDTLPLPTRHVPAGEVLRFRDDAFRFYHGEERYLEMILRKFGPEAVRQLREMTDHELERKYRAR